MYPQLDSSDDPSDEMIESCSKCYVATMPCADMVTTDTEQYVYYKTDTSDGYCEEKKGTGIPRLVRFLGSQQTALLEKPR